jgi:hypothetical protein
MSRREYTNAGRTVPVTATEALTESLLIERTPMGEAYLNHPRRADTILMAVFGALTESQQDRVLSELGWKRVTPPKVRMPAIAFPATRTCAGCSHEGKESEAEPCRRCVIVTGGNHDPYLWSPMR